MLYKLQELNTAAGTSRHPCMHLQCIHPRARIIQILTCLPFHGHTKNRLNILISPALTNQLLSLSQAGTVHAKQCYKHQHFQARDCRVIKQHSQCLYKSNVRIQIQEKLPFFSSTCQCVCDHLFFFSVTIIEKGPICNM